MRGPRSLGEYAFVRADLSPSSAAVTVDEVLLMVNAALGNVEMSECENGDGNDDGLITVDEILLAVNNALNGCSGG